MDLEEFQRLLTETHLHHQERMMRDWNRSVSFQDELFDRWERAKFLGFGEGTSIYQDSLVIGDVKVGRNTWIGPYTVIDGSGGLEIGDNCSISAGVQIYTHDTVERRLSDGDAGPQREATSIGSSVYIGPLTIVTKGVTIGHHAVVGAHSLVSQDVAPSQVVFGVPASPKGRVAGEDAGKPTIEWLPKAADVEGLEARLAALEAELAEMRKLWESGRRG